MDIFIYHDLCACSFYRILFKPLKKSRRGGGFFFVRRKISLLREEETAWIRKGRANVGGRGERARQRQSESCGKIDVRVIEVY